MDSYFVKFKDLTMDTLAKSSLFFAESAIVINQDMIVVPNEKLRNKNYTRIIARMDEEWRWSIFGKKKLKHHHGIEFRKLGFKKTYDTIGP